MLLPHVGLSGKKKTLQVDTWDNLLATHGNNFNKWTVSGGTSSVGSTGVTIDGITSNYARIQVPNAVASTTYWAYIRWDVRTATAGNIQVVGNTGVNGSAWGDSTGTAFTISTPAVPTAAPAWGERYFKIKCYGAGEADYLVLTHTGGVSGQTIRISEFKIFPTPPLDFKLIIRGDQYGNVQGTTGSGIAKRNVDAILARGANAVFHIGDSCDTAIPPSTWQQSIKDACPWGMMCSYGNHDQSYGDDAAWRTFYDYAGSNNDSHKRFPLTGNRYAHVFTLDNTNTLYKIGEARGSVMNTAVVDSDATWKIFMAHYPSVTSGTNQTQNGFLNSSAGWNWYTNNVCMVINGHNHQVERNLADSIVYMNCAKGGQDTHGWSTIETTSRLKIGGAGTTGYSGTLGVTGATAATGSGYLLLSVSPTVMICEWWLSEGENFIDPWTGTAPAITATDVTTHWLADRFKFEWK